MPRGVPMAWMDDLYDHPPVWVARGAGARLHRRRRPHLPRHVRGRHERVLRPRATRPSSRRWLAGWPRKPVPAAQRGRDRRRRAPRRPLRATEVAVHPRRRRRPTPRSSGSPVSSPGGEVVLVFDGKYHGEGDATLVVSRAARSCPRAGPAPVDHDRQARVVAFQRRRRRAGRARPRRRRPGAGRAGHDQRRVPAPRTRLPRRAAPADPRGGDAARHRRDALARVRRMRASPGTGPRARLPHPRQVDRGGRPARRLRDARRDRRPDRPARGGPAASGRPSSTRWRPVARCSRTPSRWPPAAPPCSRS